MWPADAASLIAEQARLASLEPPSLDWDPAAPVGACFACFARGGAGSGSPGDLGWAGAAWWRAGRRTAGIAVAVAGSAGGPYLPGLLALREGPLLEAAVRALPSPPAVVLVDATGRDHPRGAGLAWHLGAVLGLPTVGVTHRPLLAAGAAPGDERGAVSPLLLEGRVVGYWVRVRAGARPLAVHAAWGTSAETAVAVVMAATRCARTPEPLRAARRAARQARAGGGESPPRGGAPG